MIPERYEGAVISHLKKAFETKDLNYTITKETVAGLMLTVETSSGIGCPFYVSLQASCPICPPHGRTTAGSSDRKAACDDLELVCKRGYGAVLMSGSGYRHLDIIGR